MTNDQNEIDETGLICAYELDGHGGGRSMAWQDIGTSSSPGRTRWIHLDFRAPHACEWIRQDSGIDSLVADALLDDDSRPRVVEHGDGLLIILRGVNTNPGADPEDMVSIRIWLEEERIISTRRRRLLSIQAIQDDITAGVGPRSSADFLVNLVNKLGDRSHRKPGRSDRGRGVRIQRWCDRILSRRVFVAAPASGPNSKISGPAARRPEPPGQTENRAAARRQNI
jgi:Mg2+ and Co2+ transporter CorA